MASGGIPYPVAPANVPANLTTPPLGYRVRVLVVLASLLLFALLYVGLVVGSGYLCYWCFASLGSGSSQSNRLEKLQAVASEEERLLKRYNDSVDQLQRRAIQEDKFLTILETDILPPWRAMRQRVNEVKGASGEEKHIIENYQQSLQLQEESWELLIRAVRARDEAGARNAEAKADAAEQLSRQVTADAKRYFSGDRSKKSDFSIWKFILGILCALLCLFLVKGFFKWRRAKKVERVEITEKEQPVLFAFIRRICHDTRAPLPHRVYLTPEVNAAVFYRESLLNLFVPTSKNLIIGLGLVNQLTLSEFKAVLAHEFGHFSQNSMKLGAYVYVSNRVIAELVFGRDWLDDMVGALRGVDVRIAVFAWAFTGVMWTLRKSLQGLFRAINFANSALARQMEFNADLVAVSVTGSDALIHGLARLDFAGDSLAQAWSDLNAAADHKLYSRDLFYHQTKANDYLRVVNKNPRLGEPPDLPDDPHEMVQVFEPEDTSVPKMWATHPSNRDREVNAKRRYVRSPMDARSPWILFDDAGAVREKVTRQVYQVNRHVNGANFDEPEVVQEFIDAEHAETTYDARYHGLYDYRFLNPGDVDELATTLAAAEDQLTESHARLYGEELKAHMDAYKSRQEDYGRLARLAQGAVELTGNDFQFRGARYRAGDAGQLLNQVSKELDGDFEWMSALDRQTFLVHHAMAARLGGEIPRELEDRYRFHLLVQEVHGSLSAHNNRVRTMLGQIAGRQRISKEEWQGAVAVLRQAHEALCHHIGATVQVHLPALKNMKPGQSLGSYLLTERLIDPHTSSTGLDGDWINRFLEQLGEVIGRAQRIQSKSLGGILALQEKIAAQWAESRMQS
jgi:Zn-dependent protease with chaperone function